MNEKFNIDDFGEMEFIYRFVRNKTIYKEWFILYVTITAMDRYYIEVCDNYGHAYLIQKKDVKRWVKCKFVDKSQAKTRQSAEI